MEAKSIRRSAQRFGGASSVCERFVVLEVLSVRSPISRNPPSFGAFLVRMDALSDSFRRNRLEHLSLSSY